MLPGQVASVFPGQNCCVLPGQTDSSLPRLVACLLAVRAAFVLPGHAASVLPGQVLYVMPRLLPCYQDIMYVCYQGMLFHYCQTIVLITVDFVGLAEVVLFTASWDVVVALLHVATPAHAFGVTPARACYVGIGGFSLHCSPTYCLGISVPFGMLPMTDVDLPQFIMRPSIFTSRASMDLFSSCISSTILPILFVKDDKGDASAGRQRVLLRRISQRISRIRQSVLMCYWLIPKSNNLLACLYTISFGTKLSPILQMSREYLPYKSTCLLHLLSR
ncbi:hypothetical protein V6N11_081380 [Hibiscus sabdariffa]|uniref:Uncharacterized protein n=1 Tax=Hibiscus sabdariffa TaxID=183260 RepID=A0ABR2QJV7_9ROSI